MCQISPIVPALRVVVPVAERDYDSAMSKPALLAPGGDFLSAEAAVLAGADEVYLGLGRFNARRRAGNLTLGTLGRLAALARTRGARVFITTNVLITDAETAELIGLIGECCAAGAAGVIVQDPGLLWLLQSRLPELEVHVSTQMTVHSRSQIDYLAGFGVRRINLARELTLAEIRLLSAHAAQLGIETEVFVHGAYCVSYSGQCFMSSFMGGQSGNRGICFQPCRRFYTPEGSGSRLLSLSLKDNNALEHVSALAQAGVGALKIEGRMKGPFYVHTLVSAYRAALDGDADAGDETAAAGVFNRGFSAGYLEAKVDDSMFADTPFDASLIPAGAVRGYHADARVLGYEPSGYRLKPGDRGVVYTTENRYIALFSVDEILDAESCRIDIREALKGRIEPGMRLFVSPGAESQEEWIARLEERKEVSVPLEVEVFGEAGAPLQTRWKAFFSKGDLPQCAVDSLHPAEPARAQELDEERLSASFGKLGDTPFVLRALRLEGERKLFLPVSELNRIRRRAAQLLVRRGNLEEADFRAAAEARPEFRFGGDAPRPELPSCIVVAGQSGMEDLMSVARTLGMEKECLFALDPAAEGLFADGIVPRAEAWWFPALLEDDQTGRVKELLADLAGLKERPLVISSNSGVAELARGLGLPWIAGPDLHTANSWSAAAAGRRGAVAAVISRELSGAQAAELCTAAEPLGMPLYIPVFGPVLLMTTRQCLYRRSFGCDKQVSDTVCRDGCVRRGRIRDEQGNEFLILKRRGGWTELYNRALLSLPEAVRSFRKRQTGILLDMRIAELTGASADPSAVLEQFLKLFSGKTSVDEVRKKLRSLFPEEGALTRGNYKRGLN
jgi:U32 family peptidase